MSTDSDDALARLTRERDEARAQAGAAMQAREALLAKLGHDLRNPLGAIAAATEVLGRLGGQQPDEVRARDVIRRQIRNVTRIVDEMADLSRVLSGNIALTRAPMDLAAVTRRALDALATSIRLDLQRVDADLAPAWIDGDATRVEQVVGHLVANAARFSPETGRIAVRVAPSGTFATLSVQDEGAGIAAERLGRVFDPFADAPARAASSEQQRRGRLGVGLAVVHRLVTLHGGDVVAESAGAGRGSRFVVRLPRIERPHA